MDKQTYETNYWTQYVLLEEEFQKTTTYVELDTQNNATFSNAFLKLLLGIGSEIDNVYKEICGITGRTDMNVYAPQILQKYPGITTQKAGVKNMTIQLVPFRGWNLAQPSQSLSFWDAYNRVKHDRISNYQKASLQNTLNALAGLFILEMYRMNELYFIDIDAYNSFPDHESDLFIMDSWEQHFRTSKLKYPYSVIDDENNGRKLL